LGGVPACRRLSLPHWSYAPPPALASWPGLTVSAGVSPRQGHHLSLAPQPPNGGVHLRAAAAGPPPWQTTSLRVECGLGGVPACRRLSPPHWSYAPPPAFPLARAITFLWRRSRLTEEFTCARLRRDLLPDRQPPCGWNAGWAASRHAGAW